jgi:hypothetical protein
MTEAHRVVLDPSILGRMSSSMDHVREAWEGDVITLRATQQRLEDTERRLNSATDRLNDISADLRETKEANIVLINRNAQLAAQIQRLVESSVDAKKTLESVVDRALQSARDLPQVQLRTPPTRQAAPVAASTPEPTHVEAPQTAPVRDEFDQDDGTGLPTGKPVFLQSNEIHRTLLPVNDFGPRLQAAAE